MKKDRKLRLLAGIHDTEGFSLAEIRLICHHLLPEKRSEF
jgi:hypothetical protein